jgi:hypothetical protein
MKASMIVKENRVEELLSILATFSRLDDIRWSEKGNYNLINYCCDEKDLTADEKLLTHWLCYITDRQTPYQRIWEVGGYVISHMVRTFCREHDRVVQALFDPDSGSLSYVRRQEDGKLRLRCDFTTNEASNARLARYGIRKEAGKVEFASRYPSDDLVRMYRTLEILAKHYKRSLASFIADSFDGENDVRRAVLCMAAALDKLTYVRKAYSIAQFKPGLETMAGEAAAFEMPKRVKPGAMFDRKRLWCCVRDYLKSADFNTVFVNALEERGVDASEKWHRDNDCLKQALDVIELPGDVWNNNEAFRDGLFTPYLSDGAKPLDMPQAIRKVYDELHRDNHRQGFYPEQLDVTFDFVPRMCQQRKMCDTCLFGGGVESVCHEKPGLLCPVALVSCGYQYKCDPQKCGLNRTKGHCKLYMDPNERT